MSGIHKNKKNLIIYCPVLEFHSFLKCNLFLQELKRRYKNIKVICAIPEQAVGTISEADELLLVSNEYMDKQNANLPEVLNQPVWEFRSRDDASKRWLDTIEFVQKKYKNNDNFRILRFTEMGIFNSDGNIAFSNLFYDSDWIPDAMSRLNEFALVSTALSEAEWSDYRELQQYQPPGSKTDLIKACGSDLDHAAGLYETRVSKLWREESSVVNEIQNHLTHNYRKYFVSLCSFIKERNFLKPEFKTYQKIKKKYGSIFDEKTYIIVTRNFSNKQPETNTLQIIPELEEVIPHLLNNGIKIVNVGFPPQKLHGSHKNYVELHDPLSQNELMSLFYLSNGVILSGENGGFSVHASSMNDIFLISSEWSVDNLIPTTPAACRQDLNKYSLEIARNESKESGMRTYNLIENIKRKEYNDILSAFTNHKKTLKQEFSPNIKKYYIDEKVSIER